MGYFLENSRLIFVWRGHANIVYFVVKLKEYGNQKIAYNFHLFCMCMCDNCKRYHISVWAYKEIKPQNANAACAKVYCAQFYRFDCALQFDFKVIKNGSTFLSETTKQNSNFVISKQQNRNEEAKIRSSLFMWGEKIVHVNDKQWLDREKLERRRESQKYAKLKKFNYSTQVRQRQYDVHMLKIVRVLLCLYFFQTFSFPPSGHACYFRSLFSSESVIWMCVAENANHYHWMTECVCVCVHCFLDLTFVFFFIFERFHRDRCEKHSNEQQKKIGCVCLYVNSIKMTGLNSITLCSL